MLEYVCILQAKNGRGAERIILQEDPDLFQKTGKRFVFVGHTDKHDYANAANAPGENKIKFPLSL